MEIQLAAERFSSLRGTHNKVPKFSLSINARGGKKCVGSQGHLRDSPLYIGRLVLEHAHMWCSTEPCSSSNQSETVRLDQKLQTSYFHSSSICRLFYSTNCCKCNMSGKYCKFCITVQADAVRRLLLSEEIKPKKLCLHVRKKSFSKVVTG